jgi:XTP/dITP diphosphohydrolase
VNGLSRLVIASGNAGKLREFQRLLAPLGIEVISQADLNIPDPDEPHPTFVIGRERPLGHATLLGIESVEERRGLRGHPVGGGPARW